MQRTSAPPASRWVAKECRSACGLTFRCSASWRTVRSRWRATLRAVSRPPRWLRKSAAGSCPRAERGQQLAPAIDPPAERLDAPGIHRAEALLAALSQDAHGTGAQVEVVHVQPAGLAHPQPRAVEQLEERPVAKTERALLARHRQHREHLVDGEHPGELRGQLGAPDGAGRVRRHAGGQDQVAVERADRGERAGPAARRVVDGERAEPAADGAVVRRDQISPGGFEVAGEGADVGEVRLHRVRRAPASVGE